MDAPPLTLSQVADRLGVHYMTVYRYVRLGMLRASKQGKEWEVDEADLAAFVAGDEVEPARGTTRWDRRFFNRMLVADEAGAWRVVEAAVASGMAFDDAYRNLVIPALDEVGRRWQRGDIDVATEHAASHVAERIVARLGPRVTSRGVRRGVVVLGSTATELHDLPLAIAADLLRANRFDVVDLGANLPPESFAAAVASSDAVSVVGIGVTTPRQQRELRRTIRALRAVTDAPIAVGGGGVGEDEALALGADGFARTADEAAALFTALMDG